MSVCSERSPSCLTCGCFCRSCRRRRGVTPLHLVAVSFNGQVDSIKVYCAFELRATGRRKLDKIQESANGWGARRRPSFGFPCRGVPACFSKTSAEELQYHASGTRPRSVLFLVYVFLMIYYKQRPISYELQLL